MASNGNSKGGLLTTGGILSIVGGAFEVIGGAIMVGLMISAVIRSALLPHLLPGDRGFGLSWWSIVGMALLVLGVIAIVGGLSALRRKSFGLSLTGAICALPSSILGILAIIFVSLSKREFSAERKGNGI